MQDRFKFRVWHKKRKKLFDIVSFNDFEVCGISNEFDIDDCTLMQCTGLKDKNGKLIYEGDIVKDLIMSEIFYIVKWFNSGFYLESTISGSFLKFDDAQQEVIGNVYENPELLENK